MQSQEIEGETQINVPECFLPWRTWIALFFLHEGRDHSESKCINHFA